MKRFEARSTDADQNDHRSRWGRWISILMLLTVVAAGLQFAGDSAAQNTNQDPGLTLSFAEEDTLILPSPGRIVGLTWMGPDTLAVLVDVPDSVSISGDRQVRLVFQDVAGEIFREEDFTGVLDRTLGWNGEFLWSCGDADDGSSILYKIGVDTLDVWQVEDAFDTPGHRPQDMCFDGDYLWITDRDSGRLDRFDPEVEQITRSSVAPGFSPSGVGWDGKSMWVTDAGTGLMYRVSGARRNWSATIDPELFMHRGQDVLLMGFEGDFWYVVDGENVARRIRFE
ncbi:MAG: hypothetical protein ACI9UK_001213 [Candidatus Krumholzibacteriia bacterium]|jgi:hypothetical protein